MDMKICKNIGDVKKCIVAPYYSMSRKGEFI